MVRSRARVAVLAALLASTAANAQTADPPPANSADATPAASSPDDGSHAGAVLAVAALLGAYALFGPPHHDDPAPAPEAANSSDDASSAATIDPPAPVDPDQAALAPLAGRALDAVLSACKVDSDEAPREMHQCIGDFAKSTEFGRMVKLPTGDQDMIADKCHP